MFPQRMPPVCKNVRRWKVRVRLPQTGCSQLGSCRGETIRQGYQQGSRWSLVPLVSLFVGYYGNKQGTKGSCQ